MTAPLDIQELLDQHGDHLAQAAVTMSHEDPTQQRVAIVVSAEARDAEAIGRVLGRSVACFAEIIQHSTAVSVLRHAAPELLDLLVEDRVVLPVIVASAQRLWVGALPMPHVSPDSDLLVPQLQPDPEVLLRMEVGNWGWAEEDPAALAELERRIKEQGQRRGTIYYSDLVAGVGFVLPSLGWVRRELDLSHELDRHVMGVFLGYLSIESYRRAGFMASALVVAKETGMPVENFFSWMRHVGALKGHTLESAVTFWMQERSKARDGYRRGACGR